MILKLGSKEWLVFAISMLLLTDIAILLNVPFLRQIFGFLFLTILPGLLILQILKLNKIGFTEKVVLSVGLSVSFLMFSGLLFNNLSLSLGYETPLSTISLLILFNITFVVLTGIGCKINKEPVFSLPNFNLTTSEKAFLIFPILFPTLSIFGMHVMNTADNNIILMFMLFLIAIYVAFVSFFNQKFPKRLYPVVIFSISISLLLLMSLRSNCIIGVDIHSEYYLFRSTLDNLHWCVSGQGALDACLAISVLPTIYQSILNTSPQFLFKVLYSLIYSISPMVIYVLSKEYVEEGYAFLASCFFMFQLNFLWTGCNPRTNTAILFFALAMMMLFNNKIDPLKKKILFIVFMASCVISHYSTAYVFFFTMVGMFIGIEMLPKEYTFKKIINLTMVLLFFALIFFWYSQVTETAFEGGVGFIADTFSNLNRFFVEESRAGGVQAMLGEDIIQKYIPHKIEFVFTWLTFAFIGIGVITLIRRYKELSFPELDFKKPNFLKEKFEVGYFVIALVCSGLLVAMIAIPFLSVGYALDRLYSNMITILSVFFVIGGIILSKQIFKKSLIKNFSFKKKLLLRKQKEGKNDTQKSFFGKKSFTKRGYSQRNNGENDLDVLASLIILLVLIPYFFCVTGVMYNIFGVPRSIILNSEGEQYDEMYIQDQESYAGKWFGKNYDEQQKIYVADSGGGKVMRSQAIIPPRSIKSMAFPQLKNINGYIYLGYCHVVGELKINYIAIFIGKNRIYNNGGSEVWK